MKTNRRYLLSINRRKQAGMTLVELLVAGLISLIAALGMVIVMANTLGSGSQTIQMVRLTEEMRTAMQLMTRELRRANYHHSFLQCWGQSDCLGSSHLDLDDRIGAIGIDDSGDSDCMWFWYDRLQLDGTTLPKADWQAAAFRRQVSDGGIGRIQMTIDETTPNCDDPDDSDNWVDITDPDVIDIMTFNVVNAASFVEQFNVAGDSQRVEKIALSMTAKLNADGTVRNWIKTNTNASRGLTEFISVRNNTTFVAGS